MNSDEDENQDYGISGFGGITNNRFDQLKTNRPLQPGDVTVDDYATPDPKADDLERDVDAFVSRLKEGAASAAEIGPEDEQPGYDKYSDGPTSCGQAVYGDDLAKKEASYTRKHPSPEYSFAAGAAVDEELFDDADERDIGKPADSMMDADGYMQTDVGSKATPEQEERWEKLERRRLALTMVVQAREGTSPTAHTLIHEARTLEHWLETGRSPYETG